MDEYIFQLAFPKTSRATTESKLKQKEGKAPAQDNRRELEEGSSYLKPNISSDDNEDKVPNCVVTSPPLLPPAPSKPPCNSANDECIERKEIAHVKSNCSSTPLSTQFINYTNRVSPTSLPESMKVTKPKEGDPLYKLFQTFKRQQSSLSTSDEDSTDNTRGNTTDTTTLHKSTVVLLFSWSKYFRGHFI